MGSGDCRKRSCERERGWPASKSTSEMSLWGLFSAARGENVFVFCREEEAVVNAVEERLSEEASSPVCGSVR
jgi:hypothetical protein